MPNQSILVVDDSTDMLALQKSILEADGFDVFTSRSGTEALEALSKIEEPSLIILDNQMEDMSGTDFLSLLEEQKPEIVTVVPIVFLSAAEMPSIGKAVGFIRKFPDFPDIDVFLSAIHQFIAAGRKRPLHQQ